MKAPNSQPYPTELQLYRDIHIHYTQNTMINVRVRTILNVPYAIRTNLQHN